MKEEGRKNLPDVIERFKRWKIERGLSNEDDIKTLIEELFEKVLGWDKDDIYRERHTGPTIKRADFQFKDKGIIKLILETKALDAQWTGNVRKQAIGYGWSANKEYVILTNFQSIVLFNAKWKDEDKRIFEIENIEDCEKLNDKFDRLWLLSKESLLNGTLDRFSEDTGKKFKKVEISTIDKQLLNDLKKWREIFTKDIKSLNKLSDEEVDEVVQKIINRLIFIRVCEDRGTDPTIIDMISYLRQWQDKRINPLLKSLLFIFHHYDSIYDGTIFQKNDLCEKVEIHNNVLEKIIEQLYIVDELGVEYNFASIDADILGSVYEEYLGYLLKGKKITENHVHRKEQGIYYTPTYIVDYIVRNTLGEVLKQSKEIDKIKVLDPACGSGSFLIKSFDIFSEFWKEKIGDDKFNRQIKNNILTQNIYGVDLDPKAVEIAQLNLFLKIGERGELPKLRNNIKCGNSLIDDPKISDKALEWNQEFEDIMNSGGFDIVIGNPPYISWGEINKNERIFFEDGKYLDINYSCRPNHKDSQPNYYLFFIVRVANILKDNGIISLIIPQEWLYNNYARDFRNYILNKFGEIHIIQFNPDFKVFKSLNETVGTNSLIIILYKYGQKKVKHFYIDEMDEKKVKEILLNKSFVEKTKNHEELYDNVWRFADPNKDKIKIKIENLKNTVYLNNEEYFEVKGGFQPPISKAKLYEISEHEYNHLTEMEKKLVFNLIYDSNEIKRYGNLSKNKKWIIANDIGSEDEFKSNYNNLYKILFSRIKEKHDLWWHFPNIRNFELIKKYHDKILSPRTASIPSFALDEGRSVFKGTNTMIISKKISTIYVLALLNSKLSDFWYTNFGYDYHGGKTKKYEPDKIKQYSMPIKIVHKSKQKEIIKLTKKILLLNKQLNVDENKSSKIKVSIAKKEKELDELIFEIYEINEDEKKKIK